MRNPSFKLQSTERTYEKISRRCSVCTYVHVNQRRCARAIATPAQATAAAAETAGSTTANPTTAAAAPSPAAATCATAATRLTATTWTGWQPGVATIKHERAGAIQRG